VGHTITIFVVGAAIILFGRAAYFHRRPLELLNAAQRWIVMATINVKTSQADNRKFTFPMEFTPCPPPQGGWQLSRQTAEILLALGNSPAPTTPAPRPAPGPAPESTPAPSSTPSG